MPGIDEIAALASIAGSLGGGKQLGGIAPPPNLGAGLGAMGPGGDIEEILARLARQNNFGAGMGQPLESAVTPPASALLGPSQAPDPLMGAGGVGPAQIQPQPQEQGGLLGGLGDKFGGFFGNLDENLQSPSKIIGLGLLNRLDPRLGLAGLLGGGLLGKNKVF